MGRGRGRAPRVPYEPGPARNALIVSIEAAIALVLLIVSVVHTRLALYEEAYGFTMLRLYSHVFAGMAAVAFVLLGMAVAGVWRSRGWLPGAVIALAVATLVGLNTVNPEAIVVAANVQQARQTGRQDADYYYYQLSSDATPTALAAGGHLAELACGHGAPRTRDWESYIASTQVARDALNAECS